MGFHQIVINDALSADPVGADSSGGPGFFSNLIESDSGKVTVIRRRSQPQNRFELNIADRSPVQLSQLRTFFLARGGSSNGFLLKWPHEHNSTATGFLLSSGSGTFGSATTSADQLIGTGDGGTVDFQLVKRYTDAAGTLTRNITKPISGTVKVQSNGVDLTEGADFTVNYATGVVTLASAPTSGHLVKAGFDFYFPVRFGAETDRQLVEQPGGMMVSRAGGAIELIEDIDPPTFDEDVNHGGRKLVTMTANITLDAFTLLVQLDPQSGSLTAQLPDPANLAGGGTWFVIRNANASNSVDILDEGGSTLATLAASGGTIEVFNGEDSASPGTAKWLAADLGTT